MTPWDKKNRALVLYTMAKAGTCPLGDDWLKSLEYTIEQCNKELNKMKGNKHEYQN